MVTGLFNKTKICATNYYSGAITPLANAEETTFADTVSDFNSGSLNSENANSNFESTISVSTIQISSDIFHLELFRVTFAAHDTS